MFDGPRSERVLIAGEWVTRITKNDLRCAKGREE